LELLEGLLLLIIGLSFSDDVFTFPLKFNIEYEKNTDSFVVLAFPLKFKVTYDVNPFWDSYSP